MFTLKIHRGRSSKKTAACLIMCRRKKRPRWDCGRSEKFIRILANAGAEPSPVGRLVSSLLVIPARSSARFGIGGGSAPVLSQRDHMKINLRMKGQTMSNQYSFFCKKCNYNFTGTKGQVAEQRDKHKLPTMLSGLLRRRKGDSYCCPMVEVRPKVFRRPQIASAD